ncbi:MAG: hypothetical protein AAGF92_17780 [Myxococcota bacterium]
MPLYLGACFVPSESAHVPAVRLSVDRALVHVSLCQAVFLALDLFDLIREASLGL